MASCASDKVVCLRGFLARLWFALRLVWLSIACVAGLAQASAVSGQPGSEPAYAPDRILVQPKPGTSLDALARLHSERKGRVLQTFEGIGRLQVVALPAGETVPGLVAKYQKSGLVQFAEPDYIGHVAATPNDRYYTNGTLWGLNKIEAPAAWDVLTSASNILVAVLDTGVRYTHEDLKSNMWVNPKDGGHGWNALSGTTDPYDDSGDGHGTMVAGVLGATGNNGKGVVGVAWRMQIMACKCFNSQGKGLTSDCVTCLDYARTNGARIINASWGLTNSLALSNAVYSLRDAGIILVAACGNGATNTDVSPTYPASYSMDHVVSVAATTNNDNLASFSNYGATSVHLAAPGVNIMSTFVATDSYYYTNSGTSFAAPYVSGAFALMLAEYPTDTYRSIINRVLSATDPLPSLAGKCVTGGRLNLRKALTPIRLTGSGGSLSAPFHLHLSATTNLTCVIQVSTNLVDWSPVYTNVTSSAGTLDYNDPQSTNCSQRFYRALAVYQSAPATPIRLRPLSSAGTMPFQLRLSAGPNLTCVIWSSTDLNGWSPLHTNTTSASGTFDFTDNESTNWPHRFYRAVTSP
jgi:subtilisin family serine protease